MFSTLGFIPVPDTATLVGIGIFVVVAGLSAWYVNKRRTEREFKDKIDNEIARRAAEAEKSKG